MVSFGAKLDINFNVKLLNFKDRSVFHKFYKPIACLLCYKIKEKELNAKS